MKKYTIERIRLLPDNPMETYTYDGETPLEAINKFDMWLRTCKNWYVSYAKETVENAWEIIVKGLDKDSFGFNIYRIKTED